MEEKNIEELLSGEIAVQIEALSDLQSGSCLLYTSDAADE